MSLEAVKNIFKYNSFAFHKNLKNISQADSLIQVQEANSINWVTGHIVLVRATIISKLGAELKLATSYSELYARGQAVGSTSGQAINIVTIIAKYDESQELMKKHLAETSEEILNELAGFGFHEAYHVGQLGILRKLIGKPGTLQ